MKNGYTAFYIGLIFLFIGLYLFNPPIRRPHFSKPECRDRIEEAVTVTLPAMTEEVVESNELKGVAGLPDPSKTATYKMIRKNVKILKWFFEIDKPENQQAQHGRYLQTQTIDVKGKTYDVYYPGDGQIDLFSEDGTRLRDFDAWRSGIIVLIEQGSLQNAVPGKLNRYDNSYGANPTFVNADIYYDTSKTLPNDQFLMCQAPGSPQEGTITEYEPTQPHSPFKKELQLGYFLVKQEWEGWTLHCKPAVYLYPSVDTLVNVRVDVPKGFLTYTDPLYPMKGWNVLAKPNGALHYLSHEKADSKGSINYPTGVFPYLYYEAKIADSAIQKPEKGYVKEAAVLKGFLTELMPRLGLNTAETSAFVNYWMAALPQSAYYFIGIMPEEAVHTNEPLTITPKEDTMIRVRLYFEMLDSFQVVEAPSFHTPQRSGFTVVDWGGLVKRDPDHPFTCLE